jgi:hypothetical protein
MAGSWYNEITYSLTTKALLSTLVPLAAQSVVLVALQQRMLIPPQNHGYDTRKHALAEQMLSYFVLAIPRGFVRCIHLILDYESETSFLALTRETAFLHLAISSGHAGVVAAFLERQAEAVEVWDCETESVPLEFAIKLKNMKMIKILLGHGADMDATIPFEEGPEHALVHYRIEPLAYAAHQNDLTLLKYFARDKVHAFWRGGFGRLLESAHICYTESE